MNGGFGELDSFIKTVDEHAFHLIVFDRVELYPKKLYYFKVRARAIVTDNTQALTSLFTPSNVILFISLDKPC